MLAEYRRAVITAARMTAAAARGAALADRVVSSW
jgi:hypothetical protein